MARCQFCQAEIDRASRFCGSCGQPLRPGEFGTAGSTRHGGMEVGLRLVCFFASAASVGALLAKLYGLASMRQFGLWVALPCALLVMGIWTWARRNGKPDLVADLEVGFCGGLLATIAYDLVRIPFHLAGQRIFAPISAFGIWLTDAGRSSQLTETVGWTYHYSNGILFGVMYALFMRGRHWFWAVVWACALETLAIFCPFGRVFHLRGNVPGIAIAYLGHVAYGLPLGWLVQQSKSTRAWLSTVPAPVWYFGGMLVCASLVGPFLSPVLESSPRERGFRVAGSRLTPDWLRIERGEPIQIFNPQAEAVDVVERPGNEVTRIPAGQSRAFRLSAPGIVQFFVQTDRPSHSSLVIVEPAEDSE